MTYRRQRRRSATMITSLALLLCLLSFAFDAAGAVQGPAVASSAAAKKTNKAKATPATTPNCPPTAASPSSSFSSSSSSGYYNLSSLLPASIFGISRKIPSTSEILRLLRGGQVMEPETLDAVESIILKASTENKLVVIDFSATWCGPCKMIAPLFKELSDKIPNVVFLKVDVDDNPDTAARYNVSAMPTFVFIKRGEVVDRLMGANPARLQELIDEHK